MSVRRTWWAKLRRAEKHLGDFKNEFSKLRDGDYSYRVSHEIKSNGNVDFSSSCTDTCPSFRMAGMT